MRTGRTLHPEDVIARYRVVGPLGAGGMGEVYLARDQTLERNVALKVLPPDLVASEDRVRRFVLEAKSASSLSHPNIVTIYEIGQDVVRSADGAAPSDPAPVQFISMELVSGKTLSTLIYDERTDLRTLLGYLAQAAEGLAKAHAAGIVHRDLKPGNIMVSADGFAKVLDFGLAKLTERREADPDVTSAPTRAEEVTGAGAILGTAGYMSPEQVQGRAVDHRSDIFSFGALLYEAATRRRAFAADSAVETMHRILHDKPLPIEDANPKAPAELRRLVRRCLAKSPDQRAQSMKDIALELREIVDEWDSLSPSGTSAGSGSGVAVDRPAARPRSLTTLLIGVSVVAIAAIAVALWTMRAGRAEPAAGAFESMRVSTATNRGDVTEAALSQDGRYLAYLTGDVGGTSVRVQQVATGSDVEVVPSEEGLFEGLSFSPDGNYLFYLRRHREAQSYRALMQVPSLGGTSRERAFDVDSRASFSPDGKRGVFLRNVPQERASHLILLDLDAGTERRLVSLEQPRAVVGAPAWSPDGQRIAVVEFDSGGSNIVSTLAVFEVDDAERREILTTRGAIMESIAWLADGSGLVRSGFGIGSSLNRQVAIISYPEGRIRRVTNDVNEYFQVSTSAGPEEAIAAVRGTRLSNIWLADTSGNDVRAVTRTTNPENSPFGLATIEDGSIIYSAARDQDRLLWSVGREGGEPRPLTSPDGVAVDPRSVRGGVFYERYDQADGVRVWRVDADGGRSQPLTSDVPTEILDVTRDGNLMTVRRSGREGGLWVVPLDGGTPRSLGERSGFGLISPDGKQIFVSRLAPGEGGGLFRPEFQVVPAVEGTPSAPFTVPEQWTDPQWGPDGEFLTFRDQSDPAWNLYRVGIPPGLPARLTAFTDGRCTRFEWSPDGRRLAIARRIGDATNVWVTAADGSNPVQVTRFPEGEIFAIRWTADGRSVAVNAGLRSSDAVLIRNFR